MKELIDLQIKKSQAERCRKNLIFDMSFGDLNFKAIFDVRLNDGLRNTFKKFSFYHTTLILSTS